MTIALGVLAREGVILAADTEETAGPFKMLQSKISTALYQNSREPAFPLSACGISGAGSAAHIDLLAEEWTHVFLDNALPISGQPRKALAKHLGGFYAEHLLPFVNAPEDRRPEIEMIVAISARHTQQLLVSQLSTLRPAGGFASVGLGAGVADMLLHRLWHPGIDLKAAILLAAYVVWFVKETVPFCGKASEILVLSDGEASFVPWQDNHDLEEIFERVADLEAHVARYVIGASTNPAVLVPTAEELKAACATKLNKLLPVVTHPMFNNTHDDAVPASNWKYDFTRKSGPEGDPPKLPIAVKRVPRSTKRGRKRQPPSPE